MDNCHSQLESMSVDRLDVLINCQSDSTEAEQVLINRLMEASDGLNDSEKELETAEAKIDDLESIIERIDVMVNESDDDAKTITAIFKILEEV